MAVLRQAKTATTDNCAVICRGAAAEMFERPVEHAKQAVPTHSGKAQLFDCSPVRAKPSFPSIS
jgi:hypothetical protein